MDISQFETLLADADGDPGDIPNAAVVGAGDWEISHKDYATKTEVVSIGDQFFEVTTGRSGSYYTDYHYDESSVCEVVPKEVTTTIYVNRE
jgi:hypothetical protein